VFWSGFGQVVILLLIQIGGLGIMIFASLIGIWDCPLRNNRAELETSMPASPQRLASD
jgi:hypothetical protein